MYLTSFIEQLLFGSNSSNRENCKRTNRRNSALSA